LSTLKIGAERVAGTKPPVDLAETENMLADALEVSDSTNLLKLVTKSKDYPITPTAQPVFTVATTQEGATCVDSVPTLSTDTALAREVGNYSRTIHPEDQFATIAMAQVMSDTLDLQNFTTQSPNKTLRTLKLN